MGHGIKVHAWYKHLKSGKEVIVLYLGEMKVDEVWHEAVTYSHDGRIYTRKIPQFVERFEYVHG